MKRYSKYILNVALAALIVSANTSCNDFLDREPLSNVSSSEFFYSDTDLETYIVSRFYENFDTYSGYDQSYTVVDADTDDIVSGVPNYNRWTPGFRTLSETSYSTWNFTQNRKLNYFLEEVLPKYEAGEISGNESDIRHCIGEAYFLRAFDNFSRLSTIGDAPIITATLPDDIEELREASARRPRNEVARAIIEDLDIAYTYLSESPNGGKVRITPNAAMLFKSRVALYEGTWLKYHAGTARVPGGAGWPGAELYPDFEYAAGDIDQESKYFLELAMEAAAIVSSSITLTTNTGVINPPYDQTGAGTGTNWNPYFEMFVDDDMGQYSEVIMWREYSTLLATSYKHCMSTYRGNGGGYGMTRGIIESFPMEDGSTIDNPQGAQYLGDTSLDNVRANRDGRLQLFISGENDVASLYSATYSRNFREFGAPTILETSKMPTGYNLKKYLAYDENVILGTTGLTNIYGCMIFRGVEAMLNYIEADYELHGSLDANSQMWWNDIRTRAKAGSYNTTIETIDLNAQIERDWAVYSNTEMVDATLYCIRLERRLELMAEAHRFLDLKRWASLDMVKDCIVHGFNLWGDGAYADSGAYNDTTTGLTTLVSEESSAGTPNVSSKKHSGDYLSPYRVVKDNNSLYWGYTWTTAYYLEPISVYDIKLASEDYSDLSTSVIYQNPGWGTTAGSTAFSY
ncbi:MAG: RagB/SusD family nutrient uptake outer membrane protein [Rikenellaceae bacterium]